MVLPRKPAWFHEKPTGNHHSGEQREQSSLADHNVKISAGSGGENRFSALGENIQISHASLQNVPACPFCFPQY